MVLRVAYIVVLAFLSLYYPFADTNMDSDIIATLLVFTLFILVLFFLRKEPNPNVKGRFLKHSTLIIFGICIVHFQVHIDYLLGNIRRDNSLVWIDPTVVVKALVLSMIGLIAFMLGYLTYKQTTGKRTQKSKHLYIVLKTHVLEVGALALLVLYFYFANPLYFLSGNGRVDLGVEASYIAPVFELLITAIVIQKSRNIIAQGHRNIRFLHYLKSFGWLTAAILGVYLLSVLLSGDRGPLVYFVLSIFGSYIYISQRKVRFFSIFILLYIGAFVITTLGEVRSLDFSNLNFIERTVFVLKQNKPSRFHTQSFLPPTQELSLSARTLNQSVNSVPETYDFAYGRFQFQQLTSIIPFFSSFNELLFDDTHWRHIGSAEFITWINQGEHPDSGDGTTVIADFYLDFGLLGVILGMFFFGYLMRWAELLMYENKLHSFFLHAFFILFLCSSVYISRSMVLVVFKMVCWTSFFLYVNKTFFNRGVKTVSLNEPTGFSTLQSKI